MFFCIFAESSLYCVFGGKKYTGWKKIHHRRWCGCGLISGMVLGQSFEYIVCSLNTVQISFGLLWFTVVNVSSI